MNKIILWIAGVTDNFGHDHIKEYIPVLKNYDIKELVFSDFDFLNDNIKQYSTENLLLYISKIDDEIKKIDLDSYEEILLYGHSTGGLISILYMKYGKYCNKFNGLILNDPFIEWNQGFLNNFIIEYNKHIPLTWKFNKFVWRYNKYYNYYQKGNSSQIEHHNKFKYIKSQRKSNYQSGYIGFANGMTKAKNLVKSQLNLKNNFLEDFPVLLLIAGGSEWRKKYKKNKLELGTFLNKNDALFLTKLSNNVNYWIIIGTYHDVFLSLSINNKMYFVIN